MRVFYKKSSYGLMINITNFREKKNSQVMKERESLHKETRLTKKA